jgi:adenylate kinase family enzyme
MSAPELIVLNGVPYSGKSTVSRALVASETEIKVRHLPMGETLRAIASGKISSNHASELANNMSNLKNHTQVKNPDLPILVFEEFIDQEPADLVLLDGFPRYPDRIEGFRQSIKKVGSKLLAVCEVNIPVNVVRVRNQGREQRYEDVEENEVFIQNRLAEYEVGPAIAMETLALEYPYYQLDGTQPIKDNVSTLGGIYSAHSERII